MDDSFLTIEEYQAFVEDELQQQRFRQPDYWSEPLVSGSRLDQPVLGVRPQDAQAFCDWLSNLVSKSGSTFTTSANCTFRLPKKTEVADIPTDKFGVWSTQDEKVVLHTHSELIKVWEDDLRGKLQEGYDTDFSCDFDLILHRRVSTNTTRDAAIERARNRSRNSDVQRLLRERRVSLEQVWSVVPESFRDTAYQLKRTLSMYQKWWPELHIYAELARDLDHAIKEADSLSLIQAYLLCVHNAWGLSHAIVSQAEPRKKSFAFGKPVATNDISAMMQQQVEQTFALYAYIAMTNLRRQEKLPCWEGFYIVCDSF